MTESLAPQFFIPAPVATGQFTQDENAFAIYQAANGQQMLWSGDFPLPAIGQRIYVTMNSLGWAEVKGYFAEHGTPSGWFVGVMTKLEKPPAWLVRQREKNMRSDLPQWAKDGIGCEFGTEIALAKPRKPRVKKAAAA